MDGGHMMAKEAAMMTGWNDPHGVWTLPLIDQFERDSRMTGRVIGWSSQDGMHADGARRWRMGAIGGYRAGGP